MGNPTTPDSSPDGPSEVPHDWRPRIPQPGERPAPREEVPDRYTARPEPTGSPVPMREASQTLGTFLGDITRTGRWTAAERTTAMLFMGNVKLDLREVIAPGETLRVSVFTGMGDIRVAVPPGTRVELQGFNLLGGLRHDVDGEVQAAAETGARLIISASSLLGDVLVRTMPLDDGGQKPPRGWRWTRKR